MAVCSAVRRRKIAQKPFHSANLSVGIVASSSLESAGFVIKEEKGISWLGPIQSRSQFSEQRVIDGEGIFSDIENSYILAYGCKKPLGHEHRPE